MASSIPAAWICDYLVGIGEQHGCHLGDVPLWPKKKKAHLTEFLIYEQSNPDECIWAKISDNVHNVPLKLTNEAVMEYNRLNNRPLTKRRDSLICIKNFRPIFTRIPIGNNVHKMTPEQHLALEVGFIEVVGSEGEKGKTCQGVEMDERLKLWAGGMREDGGGGNILKLRKELEQPSASKSDTIPKTTKKPVSKRPIKNILTVEKRTADVEGSTAQKTTSITAESLRKAYNKMWQPIRLKGQAFVKDKEKNEPLPPIQAKSPDLKDAICVARPARTPPRPRRHALDLNSSQHSQTSTDECPIPGPCQTTPASSEWPESEGGSQALPLSEVDADSDHDVSKSPCSSFDGDIFSVGDVSKSTRESSHQMSLDSTRSDHEGLHPSLHNPVSSSPYRSSPSLIQAHPKTSEIERRVPYPEVLPLDPHRTLERILVPNSDTSGSVSQGISQEPKSESWSQRLPESQPSQNLATGKSHKTRSAEHTRTGRNGWVAHALSLFKVPDSDGLYSGNSPTNGNEKSLPIASQDHLSSSRHPRDDERIASHSEAGDSGPEDRMDEDAHQKWERSRDASESVVQDSEEDKLDDDDLETLAMLNGIAYRQPRSAVYAAPAEDDVRVGRNIIDISEVSEGSRDNSPHPDAVSLISRVAETQENKNGATPPIDLSRQNSVHPDQPIWPLTDSVPPNIRQASRSFIQPQSRNGDHDPVAWSAPSFLQAKGKGKAIPTTYKHARSDETLKAQSPVPRKRLKTSDEPEHASSASRETGQHRSREPSRSHTHHSDKPGRASRRPRSDIVDSDQRQDRQHPPPVASSSNTKSRVPSPENIPRHDLSKLKKRSRNSVSSRSSIDSGGVVGQGPTKRRKLAESVPERSLQADGGPRKQGDESTSEYQPPPVKKLKGFTVNFDSIPVDRKKGPNLGWEQFHAILLKTGKLRRKESTLKHQGGGLGIR